MMDFHQDCAHTGYATNRRLAALSHLLKNMPQVYQTGADIQH